MLKQKITEDLKLAMKAGDHQTLQVLRMITAAIGNKSIEKRGRNLPEDITDEEILDLLNKELKKRREAANLYRQGNRADLAEKEEKEAIIIQGYLPAPMSAGEVKKKIDEILNSSGAKDIGSAMKAVMAELKGKADAKLISDIVKERISA